MHLVGFGRQVVRPLRDFAEFVIGIIVMEPLGDGFTRQVSLGVSPVEARYASRGSVTTSAEGMMVKCFVSAGGPSMLAKVMPLFLQECRGFLKVPLIEPVVMP